MKKRLVIVDLNTDISYVENNCDVLTVNKGQIVLENCRKLKFNINNFVKIKKNNLKINNLVKQIYFFCKKEIKDFDPLELEFFNLRNDKVNTFSL